MWYNASMKEKSMQLSEFEQCYITYLQGDVHFCVATKPRNNIAKLDNILSNLSNIVFFDRPDGYMIFKDYILIFEHFEISASNSNRKGSQVRKEKARIDRKFNELFEQEGNQNKIWGEQMDIEISAENLVCDFNKQYLNHYRKIEEYKKHLIKKGIATIDTKFQVCFCVEDNTTLGSLCLVNHRPTTLRIVDIKECLETIIKNKVDYLMLFNTFSNDRSVYFTSKSGLKDLLLKSSKMQEIKMINWKPNVLSGRYFIPYK